MSSVLQWEFPGVTLSRRTLSSHEMRAVKRPDELAPFPNRHLKFAIPQVEAGGCLVFSYRLLNRSPSPWATLHTYPLQTILCSRWFGLTGRRSAPLRLARIPN